VLAVALAALKAPASQARTGGGASVTLFTAETINQLIAVRARDAAVATLP
jgi:hypothetical protein